MPVGGIDNYAYKIGLPEDLECIIEIAFETRFGGWINDAVSRKSAKEYFMGFLDCKSPKKFIFVATNPPITVGFISVILGKSRAHLSCAVRKDCVNSGIGKKLVDIAVNSSKCSSAQEFHAVCGTDNLPAHRTLTANGFVLLKFSQQGSRKVVEFVRPVSLGVDMRDLSAVQYIAKRSGCKL